MNIREQLVSSRARTWDGENKCTTITVHETANTNRGANAQAHANLQSNGNVRQASWHIQVDDKEAIRSYPDTVRCWHAGRGAQDSIAIEVCVNSDGDYNKALANAAKVVAALRKKHGLGRNALRIHHDWTGKNCPSRLRAAGGWSAFVAATDPDTSTSTPKVDNPGAASSGGGKSVSTMATEVINGLHGSGHDNRRRSLGISSSLYEQVRAEVNRRLSGGSQPSIPSTPSGKTVSQMATEVINGQHGQGHDNRRRSLGVSAAVYEQVRNEVNRRAGIGTVSPSRPTGKSIAQMAQEVIDGRHGQGHENRRRSLGVNQSTYEQVRAEVNRRAGVASRPSGKSVSQMATEVINGQHGIGHANRRRSLGVSQTVYEQVRAEVNRRSR